MGTQRTTFEKLQRERNKKSKAAAKRARRQDRALEDGVEGDELEIESAEDLLPLVEQLHADYDNKLIDLETFEERKDELIARLARAIG